MCRSASIGHALGAPGNDCGSVAHGDRTRRLSSPAHQHQSCSRKLDMPRSRAWFFLTPAAEAGRDLARYRSVSARVICTLLPEILRVPSLRNVANTAPYFHDSSAPTLEDAVRRMGVAQLNSALTDPQVEAIVAYLRTLTGTLRGGRPVGVSP
jgi:hypothetical protein